MKSISKEEAIIRIKNSYPNQDFELLEYVNSTSPIKIKCLNCNKERVVSNLRNLLKNKNLCECHSNSNFFKHKVNKEKILEILKLDKNKEFIEFTYNSQTKKHNIKVKCLKCNRIFTKTFNEFLKNSKCSYCESSNYLDEELFKNRLKDTYTLLSPYVNTETKVLLKHNECGFIWKVRPHNIKSLQKGCPKCNKKRSKGERKIEEYLNKNNILFEIEKNFSWQSNLRYHYDFYINEYNLIIEYMGQQHYIETDFCKDTLQERQTRDRIKKEECIENNINYLEISYKDFNNIEDILNKWFNDYSTKK